MKVLKFLFIVLVAYCLRYLPFLTQFIRDEWAAGIIAPEKVG